MPPFQYIIDETVAMDDTAWSTIQTSNAQAIAGAFAITPQELGTVQNSSTSFLRSEWSRTASVWGMTREIIDEDTSPVPRVPVETWPRSLAYTVTVTNTTGSSSGQPVQWVAPSGTTTFSFDGITTTTVGFFYGPDFDEPIDEYDQMQCIKEPLTTLMQRHPKAIPVLLHAIEDGLIDGSTYGQLTEFCPAACCIVGWVMRAEGIVSDWHRSLQVEDRGILEGYISNVYQGATHTTNFRLAVLHYLLTELAQGCVEKPVKKKRTSTRSSNATPLFDEIGTFLRGEQAPEPDLIRTP